MGRGEDGWLFVRARRNIPNAAKVATATVAPIRIALGSQRRIRRLPLGADNASPNSAAVRKRSAGVFSSALRIAASTETGTVLRTVRIGRGESTRRRAITACDDDPVTGGSPANIS